jgi:pSer/pThr/pTyr-binding forkhead associated (FHA) protein
MNAKIRLTVLTGPHRGIHFTIRETGKLTLGRSEECDVCLRGDPRDLCISRRHCELTFDPPNVFVDDLGSANGTFVNGHPCAGRPSAHAITVTDGDILTVGGTSLRIDILDESGMAHETVMDGAN